MALVTDSLTIPPASSVNATGSSAAARQIAAAASRAVVPLVYGEDRIGGLVLNVLAKAGAPGMLLVQVLWCYGCDSINDLRLGDEALPGTITATHYTGDQLAADATLVAAFAAQGITGVRPLTGYAWSLITMPAALFNGTLNFTARIRGRRCYDPAFDTTAGGAGPQRLADPTTWAYSEVPAVCLGDFMASPIYGCGVAVDWASVKLTGAANRAIVPGSSEMRRVVGVSFITPAAAKDVAETLRAYAGCFLLPGPSGVRLLPDANDAPAAIYRHSLGDIISIDALDLRDLNQAPTAVEIIYTDVSAIPWRDASALAQIDGAGATKPWRLSQVRMPGIHRYSQALREATERLNKLTLNDVSTSMVVPDMGIRHDDGDVITVEHPIGLAMEAMRVTGVNAAGPGRWKLDLVLHSADGYSDSVVTVAPTVDGSRLLPIAPPSDVAGLHGVVSKGIITWSWTPAAERYYLETRLRLGGADWETATPLWFGRGSTLVQQVGAAGTYTLRARHAVIDGQESVGVTTATVTVTTADLDASAPDPTPPPQPDNPTITAGFAAVLIDQAAPAYTQGHGHGTTRLYGKVYAGGALPVFGDAEVLAEFPGIAYAHTCGLGLTLRLWITWVSKDGFESATPAGGVNGFAVTTGKVGNSDLGALIVEAGNLADGAVGADKIAAAAVGLTKFAAGIEPVGIVTGGVLPSVKTTGAITFGGKLYRWDGAAYTSAVSTADLSGTIADAQIAALSASKVTGTLSDSQLAAIGAAKITGQIVGTQITNGAISTAKLAAGAVTANEIAASTITTNELAANAVTTGKLAAGAVTTAKLAAGAVTATEIAAGTITGDRLAANTITAGQIAADTITASQIAAGAIGATEIAAGAITTDKLLVTGRGAALNDDPACQDVSAWQNGSHGTTALQVTLGDGVAGPYAFRSQLGDGSSIESRLVPVSNAKRYRVSAWIRRSSASTGGVYLRVVDQTGYQITLGVEGVIPGTSWAKYSGEYAPSGTTSVRVRVILNWFQQPGYCEVQDIRIEEKTDADLIVDGAIVASKLSAGAIAVGSAAIEDGAIRRALIADAAIDTAKIADAAIATAKIGDAQITAAKIADANITTAKIADAQITAAKIVDATITTAKIADAQITTAKIGDAQITSAKVSVLTAANLTVTAVSDTINGGVTSGGRIAFTTNRQRVYDASNVLRLVIGDLS